MGLLTIIKNFLGGAQGYLIAGGLALILGASGGAWAGYRWERGTVDRLKTEAAQDALAAAQHARAAQSALDGIALSAAVHEAQAQSKIQIQTVTITKEIPRYVHDQISCPGLTVGLARVLRGAADGVDPSSLSDPTSQPDDACSDVTPSEVAGWFTEYAGAARANAQQLTALQDWVVATQKENAK